MCLSTLFCADDDGSFLNLRFENDVKMYGTETLFPSFPYTPMFENDVKMYGTETVLKEGEKRCRFENDVKMYGTETRILASVTKRCLRMM